MISRLHLFLLATLTVSAAADDIRATIERAERFGRDSGSLVLRDEIRPFWSADGKQFAYRVDTGIREHRFFRVDLETGAKSDAFDHQALADALRRQLKREVDADPGRLERPRGGGLRRGEGFPPAQGGGTSRL